MFVKLLAKQKMMTLSQGGKTQGPGARIDPA